MKRLLMGGIVGGEHRVTKNTNERTHKGK